MTITNKNMNIEVIRRKMSKSIKNMFFVKLLICYKQFIKIRKQQLLITLLGPSLIQPWPWLDPGNGNLICFGHHDREFASGFLFCYLGHPDLTFFRVNYGKTLTAFGKTLIITVFSILLRAILTRSCSGFFATL